ncbi:hypothetical protein K402DRAFT_448772 [Aulographum hederae CBS 113979]|uniref:Uncharacterized protein n=1 Tax=Aulographum hederae CBS 113979 TaxID=1176131 RepID=A0A6G1GN62_9PEZI|nr:hypothetical protein K402DRAFT_448772 [Aulographum hederae CBS 113979]
MPKRTTKTSFAPTVKPSTSSTTPKIPPPFTPAPASLTPFLPLLPQKHALYILHTDALPPRHKRNIFLIPILLNGSIALLLLWRLFVILPWYFALISGGLDNSTKDVFGKRLDGRTAGMIVWLILRRAATFALDYVLVTVVGKWPYTFFAAQEPVGNPLAWRWELGCREKEVIVRVSRGWGAAEMLGYDPDAPGTVGKKGEESPWWRTRVLPALDEEVLGRAVGGVGPGKTGYLLMGKDWDVDFRSCVYAHRLVDAGKMDMKEFEGVKVLLWVPTSGKPVLERDGDERDEEEGEWVVWNVYSVSDEERDERQRGDLVRMKTRLERLGKEGLFFRWIEVMQEEGAREGEWGVERQMKLEERVKRLFESEGVDVEELMRGMSGVGGLGVGPGSGSKS